MTATVARRPGVILFSTGLAVFAVFLDTTILYVAFPSLAGSFPEVSAGTLSWVLNAYTIVFAAALIPAGRIADRVGRRKVFLISVVLFTVGSMLCGLAPDVQVLIAARVLQAIGAAALVPSSLALVLQTYPRDEVPHAIAIWGAIGAVAGAAGPTLGALVIELLDWRWAFFINLPVGIISLVVATRVLPEGRETTRGRIPDLLSTALVIAALALMAYGIVATEHSGWGMVPLAFVAGGLAMLGVFVWRSRRVDNPVLDLGLFRLPTFRWANLGMVVYSVAFAAGFLGNVLFMTQIWGYTILQAGCGVAIGPAMVSVFAPRFGRLAARVGGRAILIPGGLVWACGGLYLIAMADHEPSYLTVYLPALVLTALGVAMLMPQLNSTAVRDIPADQYGQGSAFSQTSRNFGTTIGVALAIAFLAAAPGIDGFHLIWGSLIVAGVFVTLVAVFLLPRATGVRRRSEVQPERV